MASDLDKRIQERAYEIWEDEGRPEGRSQEHWEKARAEYTEAKIQTKKAPRKPNEQPASVTAKAEPKRANPNGKGKAGKLTADSAGKSSGKERTSTARPSKPAKAGAKAKRKPSANQA